MSDIQEEIKLAHKRAEENDKEQVYLKVSMPLFEEKELEIFDNNIHNIIEEYSKLHLEKKDQILTQRIIIKQEQEINELQEENNKYKIVLNKVKEYCKNNLHNNYQTLDFEKGESRNSAIEGLLELLEEIND